MDYREIPLRGKNGAGLFARVSPEDYEEASGFKWYRQLRKNGTDYVHGRRKGGGGSLVAMHRLITGAQAGMEVDHIDGDGLNNTRSNLRVCTHRQNLRNTLAHGAASPFKGVSLQRKKRWRAQIRVPGGSVRLIGYFASEEEAARAYDAAARPLHGRFGRYNFPREGERSALRRGSVSASPVAQPATGGQS